MTSTVQVGDIVRVTSALAPSTIRDLLGVVENCAHWSTDQSHIWLRIRFPMFCTPYYLYHGSVTVVGHVEDTE